MRRPARNGRRDEGGLFDAAETMEKLLRRAERSFVQLVEAVQQAKMHAELRVQ